MDDLKIATGEQAAVYFKYFLQFAESEKRYTPVPPNRIRAAHLYRKGPGIWDRLVEVFNRHNLDILGYLKFLAENMKFTCKTEIAAFSSAQTLRRYKAYMESARKQKKIFDQFQGTVSKLADFCLTEKIYDAVECMRNLIRTRRLATFYMCGTISKYFLAAIVNFDQIISRLDPITRAELADIKSKYAVYNTEVNQACLRYRNHKANPFKTLNEAIDKKMESL